MKKSITLLVSAAFILFSVCATAQEEDWTKFQVGIKGGWSFWYTDVLGNSIGNNWAVAGEIKYWFGEHLGFGGEVQWTSKDGRADMIEVELEHIYDFNVDYTQVPVHLNLYTRMQRDGGKVVYYFGVGPSIIFVDATTSATIAGNEVTVSADDAAFGVNAVFGVQFGRFFFESQLLYSKASIPLASNDTNVDRDVELSGPSFWLGYRF